MFCDFRPDIAALRDRGAIPTQLALSCPYQGPALEDLEAPRRQTSMDGEAIKIVIHDVDSGPICASKRRVILRKDPTDKAHRSKCKLDVIILLGRINVFYFHKRVFIALKMARNFSC